jgi:hypothetical protein
MDPTAIDPSVMRYHNWWNYYERGQTRLAAGDVGGAQADFENCVGLRRNVKFSFPEEHWRVRTYGMHFLNAYFPHRELGVCYYLEGDFVAATTWLTKSLDMQPSGRAKHYLNKVRAQALKQKQVPAPVIEIAAESLVRLTNARKRTLAGNAHGKGHIQNLAVGKQRSFIELAADTQPFKEDITLRSGLNRIPISATDLKGQTTKRIVEWIADWDPPVITITKAQQAAGGWRVEGVCADAIMLGDVAIMANAAQALPAKGKKAVPLAFTLRKGERVTVVASDAAGNRLSAAFDERSLGLDEQAWLYERATATAKSDRMTDGADWIAAQTASPKEDRLKPSIRISANTRGTTEVFRDEFFFSGEARDAGGLASVAINGEELLDTDGALQYHFARRLPLDDIDTTNAFELVVTDAAGNRNVKTFSVIMRNPEYLDDEYRLTLGIPPVSTTEAHASDAATIRVELEDALVEWPARFNLVARDENWADILTEQKLSVSELSDPRAALELGKIVTAELFLMGNLIQEANGVTIYVSIVDIDKGRVVAGTDVYTENLSDFRDRQFFVSGLARKVEQEFPFVQGRVETVTGNDVVINVGSENGVARGMKFVVLEHTSEDDTISDVDVRFFNQKWVQLSVKRTNPKKGTASVVPGSAKDVVQKGDFIVSR